MTLPRAPSRNLAVVGRRGATVRAARRRGHRRLVLLVLAVAAAVLALALAVSTGGGRPRLSRAAAAHLRVAPSLSTSVTSLVVPGKVGSLPFPAKGEAAAVVGGVGVVGATTDERSVPVASLTKIMTAYLVLKDHPLVGSGGGPSFVMTAADHEAWEGAAEANESSVEVKAGERLDERQLLQALMIASADNIADYLAAWDAGNEQAFVAKMNATAAALHLTGTHFADASGLSPGSRSTAVDMARLAAVAMENPELRSIVDELYIRLPVTGEIWNNYDPAVGVDGIIGVKSGYTSEAQSNLVTAAWRSVGGHRVLVVCAVLRQPTSLYADAEEDEELLNAVSGELRLATVVKAHAQVGEARAAWSHTRSALSLPAPVVTVAWPGLRLALEIVPLPARPTPVHGWAAGSRVGTLELRCPEGGSWGEAVVLRSAIGPPPAGWTPARRGG